MAAKNTCPPRPGEKLLELLEQRHMSQAELCTRLGRSRKLVNEIIKSKAQIAIDTAFQLELALGLPAAYWSDLERDYQDYLVRQRHAKVLAGHLDWLDALPVEAMIEAKWLKRRRGRLDQAQALLEWFAVASPAQWRAVYSTPRGLRSSPRDFESDPGALAAWLRAGEKQAAEMDTPPYNRKTFSAALHEIRGLTSKQPDVYQDRMIELSIKSGVALAWARELPGLRVSGASRWLSPRKALIQLSLLHATDADLWFAFFHQAAHILLHGHKLTFVEGRVAGRPSRDDVFEEVEADHFAANSLVPTSAIEKLRASCEQGDLTAETVHDFAGEQGIAPGIVVTRLQRLGWKVPESLNRLKNLMGCAPPGARANV